MSIVRLAKNPSSRFYRVFGLSLAVTGLVLSTVLYQWSGVRVAAVVASSSCVAALVPLVFPRSRPAWWVYVGVSVPALLVGNVVSVILVSFFFYLLIVPLGLALRLRRRDPLRLRPGGDCLWVDSDAEGDEEGYERQF